MVSRFVSVGDIKLFVVSEGSGDPVMLVHGGPGIGHYYLKSMIEHLADRFTVYSYDQRASGRSEVGDVGKITLGDSVADLDNLREALGLERFVLLGHSFGSIIALLYAARYPERVVSLALINPAPPVDPDEQALFYSDLRGRFTPEQRARVEDFENRKLYENADPEEFREYYGAYFGPCFDDAGNARGFDFGFTKTTAQNLWLSFTRLWADVEVQRPLERAEDIVAPTLVVHCENDPIPESFPRRLSSLIGGAEYVVLNDVNHFAFFENPGPFYRVLDPFLDAHS
ncbi:MAG: alpha/beta fold hydrolase [Acidimicrobiia bacterium]